jgi:hypothetical protein
MQPTVRTNECLLLQYIVFVARKPVTGKANALVMAAQTATDARKEMEPKSIVNALMQLQYRPRLGHSVLCACGPRSPSAGSHEPTAPVASR